MNIKQERELLQQLLEEGKIDSLSIYIHRRGLIL